MALRRALVVVAVLAASPTAPAAADGPTQGALSIERLLERHPDRLGLGADAEERVRAITEPSNQRQRELQARASGLRAELNALLGGDAPDEAEVVRLAEEIGRLETEAHVERLRRTLALRALLSPEQRAELERIRQEQRAYRRPGLEEACEAELEQLCSEIGPGRAARRCLRQHPEELSAACRRAAFGR